MEFKFRAIDDRTPPYRCSPSPSTNLSYFSEQALGVNYTMDPNVMHNPRDFYTIQREIEKERIRREIIMAENVHRRLLEEEVRRELMMEREMARASEMSLSVDERLSMQLPASCRLMHPFNNHWLEDRFAFPGNRGMGFGHDALPPTQPKISGVALDVNKKDKLIMLAKPNPNLCGSKRKATTPPAGSGELLLMSSKKPKEWSCALCQVSATSERGLNEHLQGKKHRAKEAGLIRAQRMCNHSTSSMSKKSGKQNKLTESRDGADGEMKTKVEEESVEANKTMVGLDLKMEGVEDSENKNEELMKTKVKEESVKANKTAVGFHLKMEGVEDSENKNEVLPKKKGLNAKTQKKKNGILTAEKTKRKLPNRKKFKFWCEDCQVGTHSAVVMESHKRGKKHMARHNESKPNGAAVPATASVTIVATSVPSEKAEDKNVVAVEGNEETTEIVTEKPEDEEVVAKEASEETTENVIEKVEDEDVVVNEANEETAANVTGDSDGTGSSIVGDVVDCR